MRGLILIGGGEHARSVGWAAQSRDAMWLRGILDPGPVPRTAELLGVPRMGDDSTLTELVADHDFVLGVGALDVSPLRRRVVERYRAAGARFCSVVHSSAQVAKSAVIDEGAVVLAGAIVGPGARIGAHAVVNSGVVVEHDCAIGAFAQVAPGVVLGGCVVLGEDAFVGLGARVRDHRRIGPSARVAMGAVVVDDVAPHARVRGLPARAEGESDA